MIIFKLKGYILKWLLISSPKFWKKTLSMHLPFVRKFQWKISIKWYWYPFWQRKQQRDWELYHFQNIGKFSLSLNLKPGTQATQTNGTENFGLFGKNGKKVIPRKVLLFSGKFPPGWTVPFEFSPEFLGLPCKW